ncbi:MAG: enoyl-CoA hydratase [Planctomycetaceae bacterium]|nr:enoyl-CoA hydratase [Planctomycetaceae bacterium]
MEFESLIYDVDERVATITLNRPDRLNALTRELEDELFHAMKQAEGDDEVRVIILTGAGRAFCAGADLEALSWIAGIDWSTENLVEVREKLLPPRRSSQALVDFQRTYSYFPAISKPVIAAINGPSVGLGFILPLYCDVRFASDQARFGTAFAQRGLIAEHGVSWILPRLIGISNALDLLYSARMIEAEEAFRIGLVSRVISAESLMDEVRQYAIHLATKVSPRSLRVMKQQVYESLFQSLDEAIDSANDALVRSFSCDDFKEGIAHFLEKREPRFKGK